MPDTGLRYPKICFAVAPSYTTKIWGSTDEVELTAGIKPSAVELKCPRSEFSKLAGNYASAGRIELYFSSPTTPDVYLYGWSIDSVKDSRFGIPLGETASTVVEQILTFTDRRWEFLDGRGGAVWLGEVNKSVGNMGAVMNAQQSNDPLKNLDPNGETYYQLLSLRLIPLLQYASGGARLTNANLPEKVPLTSLKPADLKWVGAHAPTEFQRLLEGVECVWVLKTDGTYRVALLGDTGAADALPLLPSANPLPSIATKARSTRPSSVIITSAPTPIIDQKTRGMCDNDYYWEYVGVDEDGTLKGLAELSWGGRSIENCLGILTARFRAWGGFPALTVAQARLADQTWFKMIRLRAVAADGFLTTQPVLPIINRTCQITTDSDGRIRFLPVTVKAPMWYQDDSDPNNVRLRNSPDPVDVCDFRVDHVNGILTFDYLFGKLKYDNVPDQRVGYDFMYFTDDDVSITWSHPIQPAFDTPWSGYFSAGYKRNPDGSVQEVDVSTLTDPSAIDVRKYIAPELQEYMIEGVATNELILKGSAASIAGRLLADSDAQTYRYQGFWNVSPSGNISSVRWNLRDGTTCFDWGGYYVSKSRWMDQRTMGVVKRDSETGASSAVATPAQASDGGRDFAMPDAKPYGHYDPQPSGGISVKRGIICTYPTFTNPLVIQVHPCDSAWSNVDATTTVDVYRRFVAIAGGNPYQNLATAQSAPLISATIVGILYLDLGTTDPVSGNGQGIILGDVMLPLGIAAADQYKVVQPDANGVLQRDWVYLHGD